MQGVAELTKLHFDKEVLLMSCFKRDRLVLYQDPIVMLAWQ